MNHFQKNEGFVFSTLIILMSFSLMSFHPKKNFRIEKRHYRRGYYVDIWSHPRTQPQTAEQTSVAVETEKPKKAEAPTNGSSKNGTSVVPTSAQQQDSKQSVPSTDADRSADDGGKRILIMPTGNAPVANPPKPLAPNN